MSIWTINVWVLPTVLIGILSLNQYCDKSHRIPEEYMIHTWNDTGVTLLVQDELKVPATCIVAWAAGYLNRPTSNWHRWWQGDRLAGYVFYGTNKKHDSSEFHAMTATLTNGAALLTDLHAYISSSTSDTGSRLFQCHWYKYNAPFTINRNFSIHFSRTCFN